jgi:hypothetical protein
VIKASRGRRYLSAAGALLVATVLPGCGIHHLSFTTDTRLHITGPKSRALVMLPVTISWTITGFSVVPPGTAPPSSRAGFFAVFLDRAPVRPGQTVASVADSQCRRSPGCVNATYLAVRGVYTTETDSLTLKELAQLNDYRSVQLHEATVVLVDASGRRIGESAWYVDFRVRRLQL